MDVRELVKKQPEYVASYIVSSIPFFNYNDGNRLQMASQHHVQALPLVHGELPVIYTDWYYDTMSWYYIESPVSGTVVRIRHYVVVIQDENNRLIPINIPYSLKILVSEGDKVEEGQLLAKHPYALDNELRITVGRNATVVLSSWDGYTYEDSIVADYSVIDKFEAVRPYYEEIDLLLGILHFEQEFDVGKMLSPKKPYAVLYATKMFPEKQQEYRVATKTKILDILFSPILRPNQEKVLRRQKAAQQLYRKYGLNPKSGILDHFIAMTLYKKAGEGLLLKWLGLQYHKTELSDKFTNRHGNKGVIGLFENFPVLYVIPNKKLKIKPEFALNPHGLARMNVGQLVEFHWAYLLRDVTIRLANKLYEQVQRNLLSAESAIEKLIVALVEPIDKYAAQKQREYAKRIGPEKFLRQLKSRGFRLHISTAQSKRSRYYLYNVLQIYKKLNIPPYIVYNGKKLAFGVMYMHKLALTADSKFSSDAVSPGLDGQRVGEYEHWVFLVAHQPKFIEEIAVRSDSKAISQFMEAILTRDVDDPKPFTKDMSLIRQSVALQLALGLPVQQEIVNFTEDLRASYQYFKWLASVTENPEYEDVVKSLEKELEDATSKAIRRKAQDSVQSSGNETKTE